MNMCDKRRHDIGNRRGIRMTGQSTKPNATLITKTANVCGGSACVGATRIPVWSLVEWKSQGITDQRVLELYPALGQEDLAAAWDYYRGHRDEIDEDIRSNNEA
jgi:uncharacterized protein (DUF433 family)